MVILESGELWSNYGNGEGAGMVVFGMRGGGGNYVALIQRLNQKSDKGREPHQRRGNRQGEVTLRSSKAELRGLIIYT